MSINYKNWKRIIAVVFVLIICAFMMPVNIAHATENSDAIPVSEHDMGEWYVTIEATCTMDGEERRDCSHCEYFEVRPLAMLGHDIVIDEAVAPVCEKTGLTKGEHCTRCEYKVEQEIIDALLHDFWDLVIVREPTCTTPGEGIYHCQRDGCYATELYEILPTLHIPVIDEAVPATCTSSGLTEGSHCETCGTVIIEQTETPALGHDIVIDEAVAPACEKTGLTKGEHCTRCEYKVEQEIVDALLHDFWDLVIVREPTCTTPGEGIYHCQRDGCEATELYEILPTLHIPVIDKAIPATCTSSGLTEGSHCETCGTVIIEQTETPALGHLSILKNYKKPTYEDVGYTGDTVCLSCNEIIEEGEIIPRLTSELPNKENVQTGDSKIFIYIGLIIFSVVGIATFIIFKKRTA